MELDILRVTTTVGALSDGQRIARAILQARLAACVQLEQGLTSFYWWEGQLCEETEVRLVAKTLPDRLDALCALIHELHPYQLPQFTAEVIRASAAYAAWVRAEVEAPLTRA